MSLINWNDEYTFNHPNVYGDCGGYNRQNKENLYYLCQHFLLRTAFPFQPGETILLVGAGFGWIAEDFISNGLGPVCAVDTSAWIQAEKSQHSVIEIYNYDVTNVTDQESIKQVLGVTGSSKIDWCITEDFFTGMSDSECLTIAQSLRDIGNQVIHYISPSPGTVSGVLANRNWKTGAAWKQLLTPDLVLMGRSNLVL